MELSLVNQVESFLVNASLLLLLFIYRSFYHAHREMLHYIFDNCNYAITNRLIVKYVTK